MEVGRNLVRLLDSCQTMQLREDRISGMKYFRFRVLVDLTKSKNCLLRIATPDSMPHVGILRYERLPTFYFQCGMIGHWYRSCPDGQEGDVDVNLLPYGS